MTKWCFLGAHLPSAPFTLQPGWIWLGLRIHMRIHMRIHFTDTLLHFPGTFLHFPGTFTTLSWHFTTPSWHFTTLSALHFPTRLLSSLYHPYWFGSLSLIWPEPRGYPARSCLVTVSSLPLCSPSLTTRYATTAGVFSLFRMLASIYLPSTESLSLICRGRFSGLQVSFLVHTPWQSLMVSFYSRPLPYRHVP